MSFRSSARRDGDFNSATAAHVLAASVFKDFFLAVAGALSSILKSVLLERRLDVLYRCCQRAPIF